MSTDKMKQPQSQIKHSKLQKENKKVQQIYENVSDKQTKPNRKSKSRTNRTTLNEKSINSSSFESIFLLSNTYASHLSISNEQIPSVINSIKNETSQKINQAVLTPNWRIIEFKQIYKIEGTENLNDEMFLKRHQKLENEEIKIKKWDIKRQRDELERNKQLIKDSNKTNLKKEEEEEEENEIAYSIEIIGEQTMDLRKSQGKMSKLQRETAKSSSVYELDFCKLNMNKSVDSCKLIKRKIEYSQPLTMSPLSKQRKRI